MTLLPMLAQVGPPAPGPTAAPGGQSQVMFIALMFAMLVFMLMMARSQKKREQRDRERLYSSLAKNDRVLTIGGIIGTIVNIRGDEVTLKVDESNNTKMTFVKSSIQRVLKEEGGASERKP